MAPRPGRIGSIEAPRQTLTRRATPSPNFIYNPLSLRQVGNWAPAASKSTNLQRPRYSESAWAAPTRSFPRSPAYSRRNTSVSTVSSIARRLRQRIRSKSARARHAHLGTGRPKSCCRPRRGCHEFAPSCGQLARMVRPAKLRLHHLNARLGSGWDTSPPLPAAPGPPPAVRLTLPQKSGQGRS